MRKQRKAATKSSVSETLSIHMPIPKASLSSAQLPPSCIRITSNENQFPNPAKSAGIHSAPPASQASLARITSSEQVPPLVKNSIASQTVSESVMANAPSAIMPPSLKRSRHHSSPAYHWPRIAITGKMRIGTIGMRKAESSAVNGVPVAKMPP